MSQPNPGPGESIWGRGTSPASELGADQASAAGREAPDVTTKMSDSPESPESPESPDSPDSPDSPESAATPADSGAAGLRRAGLPGGRVVAVSTAVVVAAALIEVLAQDTIGRWTGITLVVVAVVASVVTRAGDRSLPAMMPPLAFLAAALTAGQLLVPSGSEPLWFREALMLLDVLGPNAGWVVAATILSVTISTIRHLVDHARQRRGR